MALDQTNHRYPEVFSTSTWRESELMRYLSQHPLGASAFTNEPYAVYLLTHYPRTDSSCADWSGVRQTREETPRVRHLRCMAVQDPRTGKPRPAAADDGHDDPPWSGRQRLVF